MTNPITATFRFLRILRRLEATRKRVEKLFAGRQVRERDIEVLYEGLFLRAVSEFEAFLEARFFEVVSGRMRGGRNRLAAKVETKAVSTIRAIILGGDDYIKWLPYREALAHADRFLVGGRPFSLLDDGEKSQLAQVTLTRNAPGNFPCSVCTADRC